MRHGGAGNGRSACTPSLRTLTKDSTAPFAMSKSVGLPPMYVLWHMDAEVSIRNTMMVMPNGKRWRDRPVCPEFDSSETHLKRARERERKVGRDARKRRGRWCWTGQCGANNVHTWTAIFDGRVRGSYYSCGVRAPKRQCACSQIDVQRPTADFFTVKSSTSFSGIGSPRAPSRYGQSALRCKPFTTATATDNAF